ncbi:MAG: hypothetical protein V2I43_13655 [Parvularcula sp.]|nr:hypothetical protein [Parvularcula sp.]
MLLVRDQSTIEAAQCPHDDRRLDEEATVLTGPAHLPRSTELLRSAGDIARE